MDFKLNFCKEKYRLSCVIIAAICTSVAVKGQVPRLPVQYSQFFNSYSLINPASCGTLGDVEIQVGDQAHGGPWKNIGTAFTSGVCRIRNAKSRNNFHAGGLSFLRDKEGQYLRQSRMYFIYSWHTKLTKELSLSAGVTGGFVSYVIPENPSGISGADTNFDGTFGLWLYSKKFYLGGSINQIPNSEILPINEVLKFARHYNFTGGYNYDLNPNITIIPRVLLRYCPSLPIDVDVAVTASINKLLVLGINYRYNKSIVPLVGFEELKIGSGHLNFMFSYAVPSGKVASIQTYELTLNYSNQSKKKKGK
jgi:type IX secretion system PorP/SprF family membrane protein